MNRTPTFLIALSLTQVAAALGFKYHAGEENIYLIMFFIFVFMDLADFFRNKR